uniref:Retrotransposon protein, putative, Ty1-copia subclass n=3 Tax=Oryza TaxID=4527 RepID=Q2R1X4_ORYSJ|nr:retrotransposon protein, putative, Ty1-copia subclass [Oryza sativa Japonica Group]
MDVKTAFLNGEQDEEIYMDQPNGFVVEGQEGKVCKLLKSLYGLKQAPKQWHEKFDRTLTSSGFAVNEADKCVYYRHGGGEGVILCLYVDDILIFGTNLEVINEDLGVADVILNIKLIRDENGITLLQSHYVEKILNRFGYIDSKPSPTPYDPSLLLRKNKRIARNQLEYSQIIGSLMYLASATRPDISFAVSKLSRFTSSPGDDHWRALERVMRYLKATFILNTVLAPSLGLPSSPQAAKEAEKVLFRLIESMWLKGNAKFLLGNPQLSMADLSLVCEIMQLEVLSDSERDRILGPHEKIRGWVQNVKKATSPHFDEVHELILKVKTRTAATLGSELSKDLKTASKL